MRLTRYFAAKVIAVVSLALVSYAQQPPPPQDGDDFDPDSVNRGVARISVLNGDVSVQRGDSGDVVAAAQCAHGCWRPCPDWTQFSCGSTV